MMADWLIRQVLGFDVRLQACHVRLEACSDEEALHDLRIGLRRLRSLLRPLRGLPGIDQLEQASAALGRLSTPLRDHEVLLLQQLASSEDAARLAQRCALLDAEREALSSSAEWMHLREALALWPELWRQGRRSGVLTGLTKRIRRCLAKQRRRLAAALQDPDYDRHRLRLLVKRVRYADDVYPDLSPLPEGARSALKSAQATLGDWHDRLQWLQQAEHDLELMPLSARWREELGRAERLVDGVLLQLQEHFPVR